MARSLLMVEVSRGRMRGRLMLGWMDGVEAMWKLFDNARKKGKSGEPWCICNRMSFTRSFLLGRVFFPTALPCSGGYHLERGGIPLHDAVGINCKKGATTEYHGADVKYIWAMVCMFDYCVCVLSDLT